MKYCLAKVLNKKQSTMMEGQVKPALSSIISSGQTISAFCKAANTAAMVFENSSCENNHVLDCYTIGKNGLALAVYLDGNLSGGFVFGDRDNIDASIFVDTQPGTEKWEFLFSIRQKRTFCPGVQDAAAIAQAVGIKLNEKVSFHTKEAMEKISIISSRMVALATRNDTT